MAIVPSKVHHELMHHCDLVFSKLATSSFRSRFRLGAKEQAYLDDRGLDVVLEHAADFVARRLAPAEPANDGKQTPMRGHPVFIAQHTTGTCCRTCLAKWHGISAGKILSADEQRHIVAVLRRWLEQGLDQTEVHGGSARSPRLPLFE